MGRGARGARGADGARTETGERAELAHAPYVRRVPRVGEVNGGSAAGNGALPEVLAHPASAEAHVQPREGTSAARRLQTFSSPQLAGANRRHKTFKTGLRFSKRIGSSHILAFVLW